MKKAVWTQEEAVRLPLSLVSCPLLLKSVTVLETTEIKVQFSNRKWCHQLICFPQNRATRGRVHTPACPCRRLPHDVGGLVLQLPRRRQNPISLAWMRLGLAGNRMTLLWHHYSSPLIAVFVILDMCIRRLSRAAVSCPLSNQRWASNSQEAQTERESRGLRPPQHKQLIRHPLLEKWCVNTFYLKGSASDICLGVGGDRIILCVMSRSGWKEARWVQKEEEI